MKLVVVGIGTVAVMALLVSPVYAQAPGTVKVIGCLQGDGSEQKPWFISGVALPAPAPAAAPGGAGGGRGGGGGGGGGRGGAAAGAGAAPAGAAPGGAEAGGAGAAGAGAGAQAGGRGGAGGGRGGGGRGGGAAAPVPPPAPIPLVDLRLTGGMDMSAWRGMKIEVEGTLGQKPATGLQDINITSARSVQGVCVPK
ncbi:MAG TPA: hypothetical protein VFR18_16890 [Terriglobia bacterium]|nr:hypothetical protein [Terriglobia bacterium]